MKKSLLFLAALMLVASPVFAAEGTASAATNGGSFVVYINGSASLADNGIDTTEVALLDARWDIADADAATPGVGIQGFLANLESSAGDSLQIGVDAGHPGAWVEVYAVANDGTNLNINEGKAVDITTYGPWLRFRVVNVSGAALTSNIVFACPAR